MQRPTNRRFFVLAALLLGTASLVAGHSGAADKPAAAPAPGTAAPTTTPVTGPATAAPAATTSPAATAAAEPPATPAAEKPAPRKPLSKDPPGMKRLSPDYDVWIDLAKKRVVMDGTVCLREGRLELFACLKGTKEHESIVAVDTQAFIVHAALLRVGAKPGSPAKFQPNYEPATGTPIDITLVWTDEKGNVQRCPAQEWVRNVQTEKPLDNTWVFAGSGFWTDESTGQKHYQAEQGDFICVSNFPSAMLDLPVESSKDNDQLMYDAFTDHIPPRGTRVRLVLTPRLDGEKKDKDAKK